MSTNREDALRVAMAERARNPSLPCSVKIRNAIFAVLDWQEKAAVGNASVNIPEFLLEMSKQMREQPNRMTSHPFWQVRCKRYLPTLDGYNVHHYEICGDEGVVYKDEDRIGELHDYLLERHEDWCREWVGYRADEQDLETYEGGWKDYFCDHYDEDDVDELPDGLTRIPVQEIEEVVTTHLTEADAKWFIQRKQHDYPPLYTYVESAYWSPQLKQLQDWIISLTDEKANKDER